MGLNKMNLKRLAKQFLHLILPPSHDWKFDHYVDNIPIYKCDKCEIYRVGKIGDYYKLFNWPKKGYHND